VTIIEIKVAILGKSSGFNIAIFGESVTWLWHCIALEGPAIGAGSYRMGLPPPVSPIALTPSAEESISTTLNIGVKNQNRINIKFFIKNRIERKNSQSSHHY